MLTPAELRTLGDAALVVSQDRQPLVLRQRPWFRVPALARLVPDLAGEGDALAACRRPMALLDPRAATTAQIEGVSVGVETRDRPCVAPADPPVSQAVLGEPVVTMAPVGRARPTRAKRPRTAVPTVAVPCVAEATPIPIAPLPTLTPREAQLLAALAADPGASSAALGGGLGIAAGTVRKALRALRAKLGAEKDAGGAALVALARERGVPVGEGGAG